MNAKSSNPIDPLIKSAIEMLYVARRAGVVRPEGRTDQAGRWSPSDDENADNLTQRIREPSLNYPNSYLNAAKSRDHITILAHLKPHFVIAKARALPAFEAEYQAWATAENERVAKNILRRQRNARRRAARKERERDAIEAEISAAFQTGHGA